jgi:hypothetical protein
MALMGFMAVNLNKTANTLAQSGQKNTRAWPGT